MRPILPILLTVFFCIFIINPHNSYAYSKNKLDYEVEYIQGWPVKIYSGLLNRKARQKDAKNALAEQLKLLKKRLPKKAIKELQNTNIRLYKNQITTTKAGNQVLAYYSSSEKDVIFPNANILIKLKNFKNSVVLHEMAHAYHHKVLGYDNKEILDAYDRILSDEKKYRDVSTIYGRRMNAYALKNEREFFAEISEAYFSKKTGKFQNDFYPFNKWDLKKYDKESYILLRKLWEYK